MFDHVGFPVRDLTKSRAFYLAALAPLGIGVIVDLPEAVAFGKAGRAQFWLGSRKETGAAQAAFIWLSWLPTGPRFGRFTVPPWALGEPIMVLPDCAHTIILTITVHSCSTPMAIMSKRSAATPRTE